MLKYSYLLTLNVYVIVTTIKTIKNNNYYGTV